MLSNNCNNFYEYSTFRLLYYYSLFSLIAAYKIFLDMVTQHGLVMVFTMFISTKYKVHKCSQYCFLFARRYDQAFTISRHYPLMFQKTRITGGLSFMFGLASTGLALCCSRVEGVLQMASLSLGRQGGQPIGINHKKLATNHSAKPF